MKATVAQRAHFNALYTTQNPHWDAETNREVFGAQEKPAFNGHNYNITVRLSGEMNPKTGEVYPLSQLKALIKDKVEERFDHKNLYLDLEDFKDTVPTVGRMAVRIWEILRAELPAALDLHVTVFATDEQFAEFEGDGYHKS